ncbi:MAG: hypothetical protein Q7L07_12870 [Pseudohongiella sp.]|nr:hypothetical protein [Pseudohongiella sp.]
MFKFLKRLVITLMMIGLIITNVLAVTSSAFSSLLSGVVAGAFGVKTLSQVNREALDKQRMAVKRVGNRMVERTKRMITRTTVSSSVKWIPILGGTIAVGLTIWELSDYCRNLKDLDELYDEMDIKDEAVPLDVCKAPAEP